MRHIGVFIGRFQPLHNGHKSIIDQALLENDLVIVVIGSKNKNDDKNPFSFETRCSFVKSVFPNVNVIVTGIDDFNDDKVWCDELTKIIQSHILYDINDCYIKLYGPKKDEGTQKYIDFVIKNSNIDEYVSSSLVIKDGKVLDATSIRKILFVDKSTNNPLLECIPEVVLKIITK